MGDFSRRNASRNTLKKINGDYAEQLACTFLEQKGLVLIEKNYRTPFGEIDIIMRDKEYLVFIEVRYRRSDDFGGALESINWRKQQKLIRTATCYVQRKAFASELPTRFDAVILSDIKNPKIEWIEDAF